MQEIPNFKITNLKHPIYLCNLDSKCYSKLSIRTEQNIETQKHASANTKKHHNLVAIFDRFKSK